MRIIASSYGKNSLTPTAILRSPPLLLAFGFGSGLSTIAPGTFGTLIAVPIYLLLITLVFWQYLLAVAMLTVLGIWICNTACQRLGDHDFKGIVWDEICGFLITMCFVPLSWDTVLFGFVLFRLFDIIKPYPINFVDQNISGGIGIMLDDVLAGIAAGASLALILYIQALLAI